MKQVHVFVSGYVQGIGFRNFIKHHAMKNGVKGWVRNTEDGRVEALFQGDEEKVRHMIAVSGKGPMLAEVKDVQTAWETVETVFDAFAVR